MTGVVVGHFQGSVMLVESWKDSFPAAGSVSTASGPKTSVHPVLTTRPGWSGRPPGTSPSCVEWDGLCFGNASEGSKERELLLWICCWYLNLLLGINFTGSISPSIAHPNLTRWFRRAFQRGVDTCAQQSRGGRRNTWSLWLYLHVRSVSQGWLVTDDREQLYFVLLLFLWLLSVG